MSSTISGKGLRDAAYSAGELKGIVGATLALALSDQDQRMLDLTVRVIQDHADVLADDIVATIPPQPRPEESIAGGGRSPYPSVVSSLPWKKSW